ncbi:MAG: FAD/NAD(P)-binding protein [Burkholderiales bacterium]
MNELLFVGNGLAVLIAALEQARRGRPVTLLADGRSPGGHFAGLRADGVDFDIGMVMLEEHLPQAPCDTLQSYDPSVRNDWTRFGHLASRWLRAQLALRRVPTPSCRVEGTVWPDYLIANRLDAFAHADVVAPAPLAPSDPAHAANKLHGALYEHLSYADAAHANHGDALHERFIEPFVRKLTGAGSQALLARQHRAVWAPLYHPNTLRAALAGETTDLLEYPFWTTETGCVAQLVRRLNEELAAYPHASVVNTPLVSLQHGPESWRARSQEGQEWQGRRAVLGLAVERACTLLGLNPPQAAAAASVTLLMCSVPSAAVARPVGCLMVVDEEFAAYRVSSPDVLAGLGHERMRVVIEAHPERISERHPGIEPSAALVNELRRLLAIDAAAEVRVHKCLTAKNALVLPTPQSLAAAAVAQAAVAAATPGAWLTGSLLGYGVASINDQIVQALQITETLSS